MDALSGEPPVAGVDKRIGARIVDSLLTTAFGFAGGFAGAYVGIFYLSDEPQEGHMPVHPYAHGLFAPVVYWTLVLAAQAIAEVIGGATAGKLLFGLRVRARSGGSLAFWQAIARAGTLVIELPLFGMIGLAFMLRSKLVQRLGDRLAGTLVIQIPRSSPAGATDARAVFGALFGLVGVGAAGLWLGAAMFMSH